jgi:predicted RecA/RadA family phage recombinase
MTQAVFVHDGCSIDYTPAADVAAGDVVVQGNLVGVARQPIKANQPGALAVEGVFDFAKATGAGTALAVGAMPS